MVARRRPGSPSMRIVLAFTLVCGLAVAARAQDMPPMPKPGPEHALFKEDEGTWDAVVEVSMPGAPASP